MRWDYKFLMEDTKSYFAFNCNKAKQWESKAHGQYIGREKLQISCWKLSILGWR